MYCECNTVSLHLAACCTANTSPHLHLMFPSTFCNTLQVLILRLDQPSTMLRIYLSHPGAFSAACTALREVVEKDLQRLRHRQVLMCCRQTCCDSEIRLEVPSSPYHCGILWFCVQAVDCYHQHSRWHICTSCSALTGFSVVAGHCLLTTPQWGWVTPPDEKGRCCASSAYEAQRLAVNSDVFWFNFCPCASCTGWRAEGCLSPSHPPQPHIPSKSGQFPNHLWSQHVSKNDIG